MNNLPRLPRLAQTARRSPRLWFGAFAVASMFFALASGGLFARAQEQPGKQDKKEIAVKSPWGSFDAAVSTDPGKLGLPLYPGAKLLKEDADKNTGSLSFDLSISGKPDVRFMVGKFQTADSLETVRDFYEKSLGKASLKFTEKTENGALLFEMRHKKGGKFVKLKRANGGTEIDLVRVEGVEVDDK
ncbi:MAG TPA: hypothetical protein VGW33_12585 [Terriglobia bacterium]|nr:hypothetical protein [Terriglobia bacterium]